MSRLRSQRRPTAVASRQSPSSVPSSSKPGGIEHLHAPGADLRGFAGDQRQVVGQRGRGEDALAVVGEGICARRRMTAASTGRMRSSNAGAPGGRASRAMPRPRPWPAARRSRRRSPARAGSAREGTSAARAPARPRRRARDRRPRAAPRAGRAARGVEQVHQRALADQGRRAGESSGALPAGRGEQVEDALPLAAQLAIGVDAQQHWVGRPRSVTNTGSSGANRFALLTSWLNSRA